jgi:uncharacterized protein
MRHLCDANLLIAIAVEVHLHHKIAREWFEGIPPEDSIAICRASQTSFLRLLTHKIAPEFTPLTNKQSWAAYKKLCTDEAVVFAEEPAGLEPMWRTLSGGGTASPKLWMDAYLAAFAICGSLRLATFDAGFKSFEPYGLELRLLKQ